MTFKSSCFNIFVWIKSEYIELRLFWLSYTMCELITGERSNVRRLAGFYILAQYRIKPLHQLIHTLHWFSERELSHDRWMWRASVVMTGHGLSNSWVLHISMSLTALKLFLHVQMGVSRWLEPDILNHRTVDHISNQHELNLTSDRNFHITVIALWCLCQGYNCHRSHHPGWGTAPLRTSLDYVHG